MNTETPNLRVTVTTSRAMFGRAWRAYTATLGETGWTGQGTCREGAVQMLAYELTKACANEQRRFYARANGATFALHWACGGWAYDIVRDTNPAQPSTSMFGLDQSFESCKTKMLAHVAQWNECNVVPMIRCWGGELASTEGGAQ